MTPDKIYLERSLSSSDKFHSHWYKEDVVGNGIEYIRKDKVLEIIEQSKGMYPLSAFVFISEKIKEL